MALASSLLPGAASAQERRFGEAIAITEVEVPVQVLHRGEPVRGLTADDFVVLDEGEPAEVVGFRVVDLSVETGADDPAAAGAGPASIAPAVPAGRHILLLFDFFSGGRLIERALHDRGDRLIAQLHPADRVAVALISGSGARMLLGFTGDRDEIRDALDLIDAMADSRGAEAAELARRLAVAQGVGPGQGARAGALGRRFGTSAAVAMLGGVDLSMDGGWGRVTGIVEGTSYGDGDSIGELESRMTTTNPFALANDAAEAQEASTVKARTEQIAQIATLLRDVPAPKRMLLLSRGFSIESTQRARVLRLLREMHEALRAGAWTLDAYDLSGIPDAFAFEARHTGSLFYMANETGGLLFANYNRIPDATERMLLKTSVTYVFTLRPPSDLPADGRMRRLKVLWKDAPLRARVRHRAGYYAPKPLTERSPLERRLDTVDLLLGDAERSDIPVTIRSRVSPDAGSPGATPTVPIQLRIEIPGGFFRELDEPAIALQVQLYALDAHGGVQDLWMHRLALDRAELGDRLTKAGLTLEGSLDLPPGEYRLRGLVRHPPSDRLTLTTAPLTVGGPPASEP